MAAPVPNDGEILGHYRLLEQIGAGGMGVVFRARDEQLQRDVAVKILSPGLFSDETTRKQFRKEALAVGRLNHPNIAMAFDFGQQDGIDYLVTEYIPGLRLDEKIGHEPLPQKTVLELGIQLTSGLEAAHRENVIHRDLKPGNIRLTQDGQLKILDFGLARVIEAVDEKAETANLTTSHAVAGTLPYMAPEVLRAEPADERSDIWATGAVLYEMATGKRSFPDRQPTLVIDAILHYDPVRPTLINPKITGTMEAVILKCLDREPERRYQSTRELRVDLERLLTGGEVPTDSIRHSDVAKAPISMRRKEDREGAAVGRNRKILLGLMAVLLLGMAVGYLVKRWWPATPVRQRVLAVLPIETVGEDAATNALGLGLTETLTAKLVQASESDSIQVVAPHDLRDAKVKTAADARREFGTDFVLESSLQRSGNTLRINCYLVDSRTHSQIASRTFETDAGDTFKLQDQVVSAALDLLPAQIGAEQRRKLSAQQNTQPAAYEAYIRGRGYLLEYEKPENIDSAISEFNQAIRIDPKYARAYAGLGEAYLVGYQQFPKGNDWIANASQSCEKALSINAGLVEGHVCLGKALNATGNYAKAINEFQRALQSEPDNGEALQGLADAYSNVGNPAAAEATYKRAIALRPNYWGVYSALGTFYSDQTRYSESAEMFTKVTQLAPDNYHGYYDLGGVFVEQGRYQEAIDAFQRSIDLRPSLDAYGNLGYVYTLMHRYPGAIAALQEALKVDAGDWTNWGNLGDAFYWSVDRRSEADACYRKAISIAAPKLQVNPHDVNVLAYLAEYSAMTNDRHAALDYLKKALELAPSKGEVMFRAAIVYNHFGQQDETLSYLQKAAAAGYSRILIRDTPDFLPLQQNPAFRNLIASR